MMFGPVLFFLFFPVAISVNDQQHKNNETADKQNQDDWFVVPQLFHEIRKVGTHLISIYTTLAKTKIG